MHLNKQSLNRKQVNRKYNLRGAPADLLVGFSLVQPNAADQGAHHACDHEGETDPPGIHLFSLKGQHKAGRRSATSRLNMPEHSKLGGGCGGGFEVN